MSAAPQHFIDIRDLDASALRRILDTSAEMKRGRAGKSQGEAEAGRPLAGKVLAMIFERPSTRTRVSFDIAMRQMGGETLLLSGADMQSGRGETAADLTHTFYRLQLLTRRRQGVPIQPRRFFELLWQRVLEPGGGSVLLASVGGETVAGAVFLHENGTMIYKYGASEPSGLALHPNHALLWSAIRWACENGYRTFDFGRTAVGHKGLRLFKRGWGTREENLVYATVADEPLGRSAGHFGKVAKSVIQASPVWVCRGAGELLYRYAA